MLEWIVRVVISQKPCRTGVEEFPTGGILVVNL